MVINFEARIVTYHDCRVAVLYDQRTAEDRSRSELRPRVDGRFDR